MERQQDSRVWLQANGHTLMFGDRKAAESVAQKYGLGMNVIEGVNKKIAPRDKINVPGMGERVHHATVEIAYKEAPKNWVQKLFKATPKVQHQVFWVPDSAIQRGPTPLPPISDQWKNEIQRGFHSDPLLFPENHGTGPTAANIPPSSSQPPLPISTTREKQQRDKFYAMNFH